MHLSKNILAPVLGAAIALGFAAAPLQAQLDATPQSLNAAATDAMNAGKWEEALKFLTTCTDRFDRNAMMLFGPQFGVTWYRKGICEMKLNRWEDAMKSFETCYRKYPNDAAQAQTGGNIFNKRALLRWGEAAQGAEQWDTAIRMYKKFLEERDRSRDSFNPGALYINLAICHFKQGKIADGIENFETALKNKVAYKTPDAGVVAAFQALVDAVIEKRDEKSLLAFVDTNRADIVIEPHEMEAYSPVFLKLAGKAYNADMEKIAFALYQLIPATQVMLEDVNSRFTRLGSRAGIVDGNRTIRRAKLEESADKLQKSLSSGDPNEIIQLSATAFLHENHGNVRGAFAAYEQLELFYPKSKKREKHLYNLVRTSSIIGEVMKTEKYGTEFLKVFPDSEHVPAVRRLMLTSLFYGGEYEQCIQIGTEMLPNLAEGSKEHDICLHVLGGSYYYTGQYKEAQPLLDQHVELYPKSQFEKAALYFQGSNLTRLQFWAKAAKLLDAFLEKYPNAGENIYLSYALFDRANCHYALDEQDEALAKLNRLENEFPDADVIEMAFNLKGNVLQAQGELAPAEEYYIKALGIAERRENRIVAGESLNYLVSLLGAKPAKKDGPNRFKDAVPYADKFWKEYPESPYKAQVAVAQVFALQDAGRGEEALNRLRDVIAEMAATPGAVGLEEAIGSFTEVYLEKHSPDELKELYYNFPGIKASNMAARALLRIALIGVFEEQLVKAKDPQVKIKAEAGIKVLFTDLKNEFNVKDLSNFILVRVGDFIRNTNSPREALGYYDEALSRDTKDYRFPALFGRAAVLATGSDAEKAKAIEDFERILADAEERGDKDRALFQLIATQMELKQFEKAKDNARKYLDPKDGFGGNKPMAAMMLAQAYEGIGMTEDAMATYINVANTYGGMIRISAPATKRAMELFWDRNTTSKEGLADRQGAYNLGRAYIDKTRRIIESADPSRSDGPTQDEVLQWKEVEALVQQYVDSPEVKSKEELEEELRNKR